MRQQIDCGSLGFQNVICVYDPDFVLCEIYFEFDLERRHDLIGMLNHLVIEGLENEAKNGV